MKSNLIFAVIDIGANAIRLEIIESKNDTEYTVLESLRQPVRLGKDTFLTNSITAESAHTALKILKNFRKKIREYGSVPTRIVATSAVSDANNRLSFVDFIRQNCGFDIEILENQQVSQLLVRAILADIKPILPNPDSNMLIVDLGSGNVQVAFLKNQNILLNRTLKIGGLRLKQILHNVEVESAEFYKTLRAFIHNNIDLLKTTLPTENVDYFIASGSLMTDILSLLETTEKIQPPCAIELSVFNKLFERFKNATVDQVVSQFNIPLESADILLPTLTVYGYFLKIIQPQTIIFSTASLTEGVILDHFSTTTSTRDQVIAAAKTYGQKFNYDHLHAGQVARLAESIFIQTRKLLGLNKSDLVILLIASYLHDIGRYVNDRDHHKHSEYLIAAASLPSISGIRLAKAALIARNHRHFAIKLNPKLVASLTNTDIIKLEKLTAILRLANALDRSHSQVISDVTVTHKKAQNRLNFKINARGNVALEKWAFNYARELFQNITYMECALVQERTFEL